MHNIVTASMRMKSCSSISFCLARLHYYAPHPRGAFWNSAIPPSVCPSACPSVCLSCLGYRHAGCLQLSRRRPPEMCRLRTRPRMEVDLQRFLDQTGMQTNCIFADFSSSVFHFPGETKFAGSALVHLFLNRTYADSH